METNSFSLRDLTTCWNDTVKSNDTEHKSLKLTAARPKQFDQQFANFPKNWGNNWGCAAGKTKLKMKVTTQNAGSMSEHCLENKNKNINYFKSCSSRFTLKK